MASPAPAPITQPIAKKTALKAATTTQPLPPPNASSAPDPTTAQLAKKERKRERQRLKRQSKRTTKEKATEHSTGTVRAGDQVTDTATHSTAPLSPSNDSEEETLDEEPSSKKQNTQGEQL
jgi:hypothetical protein